VCSPASDAHRRGALTPIEVGVTVRHMFLIEYATAEGTFQAGAVRVFSGQ
jgi:hypothetical protein